jgi:anti-sigma B factor antagonist
VPDGPLDPTPPVDNFTMRIRREGGAVVVAAVGEIDLLTAPVLADALDAGWSDPEIGIVVLDLTEVSFLGSSGLAVLLEAGKVPRRDLRVVPGDHRLVRRPLEISGLARALTVCDTVEDALLAEGPRADTH